MIASPPKTIKPKKYCSNGIVTSRQNTPVIFGTLMRTVDRLPVNEASAIKKHVIKAENSWWAEGHGE